MRGLLKESGRRILAERDLLEGVWDWATDVVREWPWMAFHAAETWAIMLQERGGAVGKMSRVHRVTGLGVVDVSVSSRAAGEYSEGGVCSSGEGGGCDRESSVYGRHLGRVLLSVGVSSCYQRRRGRLSRHGGRERACMSGQIAISSLVCSQLSIQLRI